MYHYSHAVLGGTFDRLHKGHKAFFRFALSFSNHLCVGITSDTYVKEQKHISDSLSFEERKQEVEAFFKSEGAEKRVTLTKIQTNEIPEEFQKKADAIIVTVETLHGAEELNKLRGEKGYSPLPVVTFSTLLKGSTGQKISSTSIRSGEVDRNGDTYLTEEMKSSSFLLPTDLRSQLKEPFGEVVDTSYISRMSKTKDLLITVGDITTSTFLAEGVIPSVSVVDLFVQRKKTYQSISDIGFSGGEYVYHIENPTSHIAAPVFMILSHIFTQNKERKESSILQIIGEEDLIVLPVILLAPLHTQVFYGQPGKGMVRVIVTERLKQTMRILLRKFKKQTRS